jgi:AraC-like DNA-binding protein
MVHADMNKAITLDCTIDANPRVADSKPYDPQLSEASARPAFQNGGRPLYGGFHEVGVSIEWHDLHSAKDFEWSRNFQTETLGLCLNLGGDGDVRCASGVTDFGSLTAAFYLTGRRGLEGRRQAGQQHRFITIQFSAPYLRRHLAASDGALHPLVEGFVRRRSHPPAVGEIHRLTSEQEQLIGQMLHPPVFQSARALWYQGKVLGLMAAFFFEKPAEDELFCDRQKRLARERVDKVIGLVRGSLAEPPTLEELGRKVGCSHFYLSRTFSSEMGVTIPQFLRKLRMERAAELLKSGDYNVTEAAMEVGYNSLSHFSQAFCQTMGCCPALYPLKR